MNASCTPGAADSRLGPDGVTRPVNGKGEYIDTPAPKIIASPPSPKIVRTRRFRPQQDVLQA